MPKYTCKYIGASMFSAPIAHKKQSQDLNPDMSDPKDNSPTTSIYK